MQLHAPPGRFALSILHKYSAPIITLAGSALLWLTAFVAFRQTLWRDPHTAFFQDKTVYNLGYSLIRQDEGRSLITEAERHPPAALDRSRSPAPVLCAGITTFKRDRQYLNDTIGSMLAGLTPEERSALDVRVLFTHAQPEKHPDWNKQWLGLVDQWSGYNVSKEQLKQLQEWEDKADYYAKGVWDYVYMIQQCLLSEAPYIAIFEDDIIFADGWLSKTFQGLADLRDQTSWLYLRLFYTETSLGWEENVDFWYGHMTLTFGLAMVSGLLVLLVLRRLSRLRRVMDNTTIAVLVLVTIPAFTALVFMVGKYNLMPLHGVVKMDKWGCCTQALVFPRNQIDGLLDMLSTKAGQTDSLIEDYADAASLQRYALAPQVVQHVGLVSSRTNTELNTKSTWAFWFEAQNPAALKAEHKQLAKVGSIWRGTST